MKSRFAIALSFAAAAVFCVAAVAQDPSQDQSQDPAAANVAPSGPSYTTEAPPPQAQQGAPPPQAQQGAPAPGPDDQDYSEQPTETTAQAPPALPDYEQPPAPGDGYIWTPGYWAWSPNGYYWVPGAWVEPPYPSALWTPGYWGYYGGRYMFYPGHWGLHIGFYGGINYGFGYVGLGYEGGYWHGGHFFYNRVYNNVDVHTVRNVYSFNAHVNVVHGNPHASYHGGTGGVQARPGPSDRTAWREPTSPRMNSQVQHAQSYSKVQGQFANQNHGRPAQTAVRQPLPADHNVHPQSHGGGGQQQHH